jgi:hypothetical protein
VSTYLLSLPIFKMCMGVGSTEDFCPPPIIFYMSDGATVVPLTGITFSLTISRGAYVVAQLTSANGGVTTSGGSGTQLQLFWPAALKTLWSGLYTIDLLATDSTGQIRNLTHNSSIVVGLGQESAAVIQAIYPYGALIAFLSPLEAATATSLATLWSAFSSPTEVSASTFIIGGSGWYDFTATGAVTVTLPPLAPGEIILVTDGSFASSPAITISGAGTTLIGNSSSYTISNPGGSALIIAGNTAWRVLSGGGSSGGGGGGGTGIHIGTDLKIGSTELL